MKFKISEKRFLRQLLYFIIRLVSEKNAKTYDSLAGYSFDSILHHVNVFGTYEKTELFAIESFLKKYTRRFDTALDVGANIGNHTHRFLSKKFGRVYCYEPNPQIFDLLSINMKILDNVTCFNYGLSERNGSQPFFVNKTNLGASRILAGGSRISSEFGVNFIQVRPLDGENINRPVDLIKLDVEGHELSFFKGAIQTIKEDKPIIIFEENNIAENGLSEPITFLRNLGYVFFTIQENWYFGDGKFRTLLRMLMQDIFGIQLTVVETDKFDQRVYPMIIAVPSSHSAAESEAEVV